MNDFIIFADSACDLSPAILAEWGVDFRSLTFRFDGEDKEYGNGDMNSKEFYQKMRDGGVAKTAAVNTEAFREGFEKHVCEGKDILYLGFSGGLSTTSNSARLAANEVMEKYPERRIVVIDTLSASAGISVLMRMVLDKKESGASLDDCAEYAKSLILGNCHWFTVDDLVYLKRGGRVSPTVAFVGNALGIKPVLHVDNEGKLISMSKVRGRKTSLSALVSKYTETAANPAEGTVFISHGDCLTDAEEVARLIKEKHNVSVEMITDVGTVIGAHSGPGTIALFFVANER